MLEDITAVAYWFDELGPPWDKHGCFDDGSSGGSLRKYFRESTHANVAPVFGVVLQTTSFRGRDGQYVRVRCSDGTMIAFRWIPFARMRLGQLVLVQRRGDEITMTPVESSEDKPDAGKAESGS